MVVWWGGVIVKCWGVVGGWFEWVGVVEVFWEDVLIGFKFVVGWVGGGGYCYYFELVKCWEGGGNWVGFEWG